MVDGIAASNFIVQQDGGLTLDAAASERIKYHVRARSFVLPSRPAQCHAHSAARSSTSLRLRMAIAPFVSLVTSPITG